MKLKICALAIVVALAGCSDRKEGVQYAQPQAVAGQPQGQAPVIVQQQPAADNSLMTGALAGVAGYMLGRSSGSNNAAPQPAQVIERRTVVHHYINRPTPEVKPVPVPTPAPVVPPVAKPAPTPNYSFKVPQRAASTPSYRPSPSYSAPARSSYSFKR